MAKKYKFEARIEAADRGGACVLFPYNMREEFGTEGKVPVKATFDGVPYTGSLVRYGRPQHILGVLKSLREKTGKGVGDKVEVILWRDDEPRSVEIPRELHRAMKREKLLPFFEQLSYTNRKEYCRWVAEAKKEETRQKRLEKAVALLKKGMKTPA